MRMIIETGPNLTENGFDLSLLAIDTITVFEVSYLKIIIIDLADVRSLNSVVAALARGVIDYAEQEGFLN